MAKYSQKKIEILRKIRQQNRERTYKELGYNPRYVVPPLERKFKPQSAIKLNALSEPIVKPKKFKKQKPGVKKTSLGEKLVADWLLKNGIRFKREKEFADLINPMTGKALLVDFYLHAHKICIEFDGRQHFKASKMFDRNGDSLEARIRRDRIKDAYCIDRGFKMIRIKYTEINFIAQKLSPHFTL